MVEEIGGKSYVTSFARRRNLPNLMGRIDYISNPNRQEFKEDFYDMEDKEFWMELAKQSKDTADYNKNKVDRKGKPFKPIQAVEYMVRLTPEIFDGPNDRLLVSAKQVADSFYKKFGYKCCVAIHHSKARDENGRLKRDSDGNVMRNYDNLHCHLIMCDREIPNERIRKKATRDIYYDSTGKRVYRKNLADPSKTIKKGEYYKDLKFGTKVNEIRDFKTFNEKMHEWSNEFNNEHSEYLTYYRPNNVGYGKDLEPQLKIGNKRPPKSVEFCKNHNKEVRMLNAVKKIAIRDLYSHEPSSYYGYKYTNSSFFYLIDKHMQKASTSTKHRYYQMAAYVNRNADHKDRAGLRNDIPYSTVKGFHAWLSQNQKRVEEEIEKYLQQGKEDEYSNDKYI